MKLQTAKCTACGASLKLEVDKAISECSYCKSQIIVSNALDFNKVEVDKSKDIVKYRDNLKKYVRNNSIEEILRVSNQILDILPKDFLATYFAGYAHQVKGEPNYIYEFYSNILEHTPNELEEVIEHINKRSDLRDDSRIIKFLNKKDESYVDKYKQTHLTRLELEDNYSDIPRDIFLSYKSKDDNQLIEKIVSRLEEEGYSVWVSYRNLRPNDNENYWSSIEKAIKNTNIFLVVSEAASMRSKDVQKEIDFAFTYKKKLIEFKIDQTPHTQLFKHVFDGIKWVEGVSLKKGLEALTQRIFDELNSEKNNNESEHSNDNEAIKKSNVPESDTLNSHKDDLEKARKYLMGDGVYTDPVRSFEILRNLAEAKNPEGQYEFASLLYHGYGSNKLYKNQKEAIKFFKLAFDNGIKKSLIYLADANFHGYGTIKNLELAYDLYASCINTEEFATIKSYINHKLGEIRYSSKSLLKNYDKAFEHFNDNCNSNYQESLYMLGVCYENGHGVLKDLDKANEFYQKAAFYGNLFAKAKLTIEKTANNINTIFKMFKK
jgi:hypothetical protein